MEPVSLALSVVPLAVQLGKGIHKLLELLQAIEDAPSEISSIIDEAEFLRLLLTQITTNDETLGKHRETELALQRCQKSLGDLCSIAESFASGFSSKRGLKRRWTAVEIVGKKQDFVRLKSKLCDAKLDLLIAQQISSARYTQAQNCTNQQSLFKLLQGFTEVRQLLENQNQLVTSRSVGNATEFEEAVMALQKPFSASSCQIRNPKAVETGGIRAEQNKHSCITTREQRVAGFPISTVTRTPMGTLYCWTTTYYFIPIDEDKILGISKAEKTEVVTRINFIPSWWITRIGMSRVMELISTNSSTQGWQYHLRTFNYVPKSSLIFEFCRLGNTDAVKHLLAERKASVNDMNEYGETPLHVAAGYCHADLCDVLLRAGSCRDVRQLSFGSPFTAFSRVFRPGTMVDHRTMQINTVTSGQFEQTIRAFLRSGEELEHVNDDFLIPSLIYAENFNSIADTNYLRPSLWIIGEVLPVTNSSVLDLAFWESCLQAAVCTHYDRHPSTEFVLGHCSVESIRRLLLRLLQSLNESYSLSHKTGDIRLLLQASDGLHFFDEVWGETPISQALKHPRSFAALRIALAASSYDFVNVAQQEIQFRSNGWTETRLLSVFEDTLNLNAVPSGRKTCRDCGDYNSSPCKEQALQWKRRVRRYKEGLDQDVPLNEAETQEVLSAENDKKAHEKGICCVCQGTLIAKRWHA
ncbi:hypothetical protein ONS96_010148 [Cadophora gregata f. sp. sojae]|nr:hypothetical protein ONS96_010148 [Cadophora gregata f. sp. sojae]